MGKVSAIIPAAGQGRRMGGHTNKQLINLGGYPLLFYTLQVFEKCSRVDEIIPVVAPGEEQAVQEIIGDSFKKISLLARGGAQRQDSVASGLKAARGDIIIVHDGARPFATQELLEKAITGAEQYGAVVIAVPAKDTIKMADEAGYVISTPPREKLWLMQTPQAFQAGIIRDAYSRAAEDGFLGTDDASLVERIGHPVKLLHGSYENIKITTPEDMVIAETILHQRMPKEDS